MEQLKKCEPVKRKPKVVKNICCLIVAHGPDGKLCVHVTLLSCMILLLPVMLQDC